MRYFRSKYLKCAFTYRILLCFGQHHTVGGIDVGSRLFPHMRRLSGKQVFMIIMCV